MLASSLLRTSVRVAPRVAAPFVFGARGLTSVAALPQAARLPRARWTIGAALALAAAATYAYTQHNEIMAAEGNGLSSKEFVDLKLVKRSKYNHNTDIFVFALPNQNAELDLPVASYVVTSYAGEDGKPVVRPYTPINQHERGTLTLLVKDYPEGKMSSHIHHLKEGDKLAIKGPLPKMAYKPNHNKRIGMIAGGTGLTPMLQVIEEILSNPADKTEVKLIFANTSSKDILLKEKLDALAAKDKRLQVTYLIDKPESGWKGEVGYITAPLLKKTLFPPSDDSLVLVCGPPGFMKAVSGGKTPDYKQGELTGALKELGFTEKNVMKM